MGTCLADTKTAHHTNASVTWHSEPLTPIVHISEMPTNVHSRRRLFSPFDVTPKLAFQYCEDPRTDRPTADQAAKYQFIVIEDWFCYPDFQNYHGPSNLAHIIRFSEIVEDLHLESGKTVCVRTSLASMQRTNVALLISIHLLITGSWSVDEICQLMEPVYATVVDYRTEGEGPCDHHVSIRDCLLGLQLAFNHLDTLNLTQFDVEELLLMEQPRHGDMNWIVPGRLLALAGPTPHNWPISRFVTYAHDHAIGALVRLNRAHYPATDVTQDGSIEHIEMFMHDGTNPTESNIRDFIQLVERMNDAGRAVAVHCRAGLGRTGTMIAAYLLWKCAKDVNADANHPADCPCVTLEAHKVARAIIGFIRIMRPASVLSGQPEFLEQIAPTVMHAGRMNRLDLIVIEGDTSDAEPAIQSATASGMLRQSKRLRASAHLIKTSDELLVSPSAHHPKSHAGRGHAAQKHSTVSIDRV